MNTPNGIIFIYSEYKKGGSLPLALVLEENGFEQILVEGKMGQLIVKNKLDIKKSYKNKIIFVHLDLGRIFHSVYLRFSHNQQFQLIQSVSLNKTYLQSILNAVLSRKRHHCTSF